MLDFFTLIPTTFASGHEVIKTTSLSLNAIISIIWLVALFSILITEKINKTIVSILIAWLLIILQVFHDPSWVQSSQEIASGYIYHNLDIFAFIIGMMIISGIAKDSWVFDYLAIQIVRKLNAHPIKIFYALSYIAFFMTVFISNIPTIIILAPIVVLITRKLDLPTIPYIIGIITFANLWWAVTPISDPTTYFQAKTLWLSFFDVISNTGLIMFIVTISSSIYLYLIFRKDLKFKPDIDEFNKIDPLSYIKNKKELIVSLSILSIVILIVIFKEYIASKTWLRLDNWTITLFGAFLLIMIMKHSVSNILNSKVDYATLFFFAGLFIVVWSLEYNWVIVKLADELVKITWWSEKLLLLMLTMWSATLSIFIDNVPYNIAMVSTLEAFKQHAIVVWPAWTALAWGLNSCTSIGWAGSPIGSACNVIALGQAEKNWVLITFSKYLIIWVPLVFINSAIAYWILYFRYLF